MNKPAKLVAAAGTIALAGGIGAGLAYADSPTDSPTASPTAQPSGKDRKPVGQAKHRRLIARAIHGEVTLAGQKHRVIAFQRGTVAAVSATSLTVKSPDGYSATYLIKSETKVRQGRATGPADRSRRRRSGPGGRGQGRLDADGEADPRTDEVTGSVIRSRSARSRSGSAR